MFKILLPAAYNIIILLNCYLFKTDMKVATVNFQVQAILFLINCINHGVN